MTLSIYVLSYVKRLGFCTALYKYYYHYHYHYLEDDPRSGRPCTATSPQLCEEILLSVRADRRVTVRRLAEIHGVSKSSIDVILRERLHMKKLCARWVPRMLTLDQKCHLIRLKLPSLQLINVAIGCFHTHPTRLTLHR